jgi:hypothetical protein
MSVRTFVSVTALWVFAIAAVPELAESTTINFASLESTGTPVSSCCGQLQDHGTYVTVDGFIFTSSNDASYGLSSWAAGDLSHPTGGTSATSLFEYLAGATTTITKAGEGSTFTLTGIDFTEWGKSMPGGPGEFGVTLIGTKGDLSTVTQTVDVTRDGSLALQSFILTGFTDVTKVTMIQGTYSLGTAYQFNNLVVDGVASVPDSGSTLTLLSVAGAWLIAVRRRLI